MNDTIFAVSSGRPPAAIAVLRISGPDAFSVGRALVGSLPVPRRAALRSLQDPADGTLLDQALVLVFDGPRTATGEDILELHLHGGRAVVDRVGQALASAGLRPANPGEFTRRALANGILDLTEAEGLADLLSAETEAQRRMAINASGGSLRRLIEDWTGRSLTIAASIEALLDHADEDDVDASDAVLDQARSEAGSIAAEIDAVLASPPVERLRDGIRVVLAGPPNAGKSTLLNALVERDAAIVSAIAGTTRDRIEIPVSRDGIAWLFTDTAGLRHETDDAIERIGIDRTVAAIADADIILWLGDGPPPMTAAIVIELFAQLDVHEVADPSDRLGVSAVTGEGLAELWSVLAAKARELLPAVDTIALNKRQRDHAGCAAAAMGRGAEQSDPLLLAEELRYAVSAFAALTGANATEAMLDTLFGRFCIGK